jgi:DNA-binding NtrC family response regulator
LVTGKWLVAIVDDELDIANLFREYLSGIKGILVFTFTDPVIALEHFISNKYEYFLIISDLKMPRLSGIEFIKKVKKINPFVRTLLMTSFEIDDPVFEEYKKKEIINDFLQKPVRFMDFRSMVEKHLNLYTKI